MKLARLARLALATLLVCLVGPSAVSAHSGVQSYIYVSLFDDAVEGRVEYPIPDLADILGIELSNAPSTIDDLSTADRAAIVDYTRDHIEMADDDGPWQLRFDGTVSYLAAGGVGYILVPFDVIEDFDEAPSRWTVTYDGVIEANPERDALFLVENDWRTATFDNEGEHLLGFSVGNETQVIELESVSAVESLGEVARRGTVSVDRSAIVLAAVIAVVVAAVLAGAPRRNAEMTDDHVAVGWRPTLVEAGTRVGIVIAGQSASLWVIGLAGVGIGQRLAMATGALGVLIAAATWWTRGAAARAMALGVGLLSGVGMGAAFVDQQLHRAAQIRSLIAFDLGAATMVAVVALLLLPLLLIVRHSRAASTVGLVVVGFIATAGSVWLVESSSGARFRLRTAELQVADAVTSPIIVPIVTAAVAAVVFLRTTKQPPESHAINDGSPADSSEPIEVR